MKIHLLSKNKTNYVDKTLLERASEFDNLVLEEDIKDSNFLLLPHTWEYYYQNRLTDRLLEILEMANKEGKQIIGVTNGDFGYTPLHTEAVLLRRGGKQRKKRINQIEVPRFFEDPIMKFYDGNPAYRPKQEQVHIGFCGKVNTNIFNEIFDTLELLTIWLRYQVDKFSKEPTSIFPTPNRLRNNVLKACDHPKITNDFILRKKFMNGLLGQSKDVIDSHKSTLEFFNNIRHNDYTLCMRGVGNYSIRFYQTLAMGRIPIFINTDCMLPFDELIEWKKILPWIEYKNLDQLPEIILDYHHQLSEQGFLDRQRMMRNIWEKYLSRRGYFNHLGNYIETFANHTRA